VVKRESEVWTWVRGRRCRGGLGEQGGLGARSLPFEPRMNGQLRGEKVKGTMVEGLRCRGEGGRRR